MSLTIEQHTSPDMTKLRNDLVTWLRKKEWSFVELSRWLTGYSLPVFDYEEESYSWILRGLEGIDNSLHSEFAKRIGEFLENIEPSEYLFDIYDDEFLYNLFYLSAGLHKKHIISKGIMKTFHYFQQNDDVRCRVFSDKNFYDISLAYREAILMNQIDKTFIYIWKDILNDTNGFLFTPNPFYGFRGILYMPLSEGVNKPDFDEIGWALRKVADYLEPEGKRQEKIRQVIKKVDEVWGSYFNLNDILIHQFIKNDLPKWSFVKLDSLIEPVDRNSNKNCRLLLWKHYVPFLKEININPQIILQSPVMLTIEIPQVLLDKLKDALIELERNRLKIPFKNYDNVVRATNEYWCINRENIDEINEELLNQTRVKTYNPAIQSAEMQEKKRTGAQEALAHTARGS